MKRRQLIMSACGFAAVILIAVVTIILITRDMGMLKTSCELYFMNEAETSIEAEIREIKYSDANRLPENVIIQLMNGPEDKKHKRLISRDTKLLHMINENGRISVDLSSEFLNDNSAKNMQAVYSIVKSLCSINGIMSVRVTVRGEEIPTTDGKTVGYLTASDINLSTDLNTSETNRISLYFTKKDSGKLYKTSRTVRVADQQPIEYYIVSGLIKGPSEKEYESVVDKGTELISVDTEEDICFVNLSSSFVDKNSGEKAQLAVYAIVNSLTELNNINRVQFLIDGKKVHKFGNMDIFGIYQRNNEIIG
ncbi:MAG: GerMN domain-containing protein [bacterium]|nr:GerMN domain-containing protein [bacterium]